ncbi:DNA repair protein RadC [bacterium]|nr:DNA repair protein RadC [bacterium]
MTDSKKKPEFRENLRDYGADKMSIPELIAIVLNTGSRGESISELSDKLLKSYGTNQIKDIKDVKQLQKDFGLPFVKSCQLVACFELGRRLFKEVPPGAISRTITSPEDVYEFVKDMRELRKEKLRGLYLNARNHVIYKEDISIGTQTANLVSVSDILRPAIEYAAVGIIIVHNHPSGDPDPSDEDIEITKKIVEATKLFDIKLLDHVIVGKDGFKSLNEMGVL